MVENQKFNPTVELAFGYQSQDPETPELIHRSVKFAKRPTGADFIAAGESTNGQDPDFMLALMTAAIAGFGNLPMPVPMTVMLALNWRDREILTEKFYAFLGETSGNQEAEVLENGKVRLAFGVERAGVKYTLVEFGVMLNAYDEIAIRKETNSPIEYQVLTIGREIARISTTDGQRPIEGSLTLDELKNLDWSDFVTLQSAEESWRESFRV